MGLSIGFWKGEVYERQGPGAEIRYQIICAKGKQINVQTGKQLDLKTITIFWFPLAAMWIFMGIEQPGINAVVARLSNAKENLAAFGVTLSIALIIEAPIIQLLAAATALADHYANYRRLLRFMHILAAFLTGLHLLLALTPLYSLLLIRVLGVPESIVPLSRSSFLILTPWAAVIGYRRLWQGVLIRYGKSKEISFSMLCRLAATMGTLFIAYAFFPLKGAEIGALALSVGVTLGAVAAFLFAFPLIRSLKQGHDKQREPEEAIAWRELLVFYYPLALTSIITFLARPVLSWGIARAFLPLESLAVWPVVLGLMFLFRSMAMAFQEVAVSLLKREGELKPLVQFTRILASLLFGGFLLVALTPAGEYWFSTVSGLSDELLPLALRSSLFIALVPPFSAAVSWFRGYLIYHRNTDTIAWAVALNSLVLVGVMVIGPMIYAGAGVDIAAAAFSLSLLAESILLGFQVHRRRI